MSEFHEGDEVRGFTFLGTGTVTAVAEGNRGRMIATVQLVQADQNGARNGMTSVMFGDLLPAGLPGYDIPFTPARGNLAWITPVLVRDIRDDQRIGPEMQDRFDQALAAAGQDPDNWADLIGEMGQFGWAGTIRRVAAEKGLV